MRTAFVEALTALAADDPRIWLLTGDLGYGALERFRDAHPQRYLNAGVAEQDMTGIAVGMARCGKVPFTYSIANFPTFRCLEQIRNDVCYHEANVKIVSVGVGFSYGAAGYTHHGVEDVAIMRALPGMTIVSPADPVETQLATRALAANPGPAYLRLGKAGEPTLHSTPPPFELGRAICLAEGSDLTLISTGPILKYVLDTEANLRRAGIRARVLSMHTLSPIDRDAIHAAARETPGVVTVEEHSVVGGLGSAVAEVMAQMEAPRARLRMVGIPPVPQREIGSQTYLRRQLGDLESVAREVTRPA